ncbi:formate dehydrogenase accessory protein FdhE [Fundidesulfovibrio putealis]|uniref:formate dehydrogenase accessory protein FdhE n=1 Tax=Fundidesulfovibrio putealis TaxID=270496 RepID=UPI00041529C1|nr:formate dehydrogenase accessory protein FdhE [Fundidesulfovibrio putealis]
MFDSLESEQKRALRKMADLRKKPHIPAQLLTLVEIVMNLQNEARANAPAVEAPRELLATVDQVLQGAPLLAREAFVCDREQAAGIYGRLTEALSGMGGPMAQAAGLVREQGDQLMRDAFDAFIKNDAGFFAEFAKRTPNAPRTLNFLAQSSLTPGIMALAESISKLLPENRTWDQGTCPLCGSLPFHSSLVTKEGVRVNSCSFCRADYRSFRLQCVYCQERDAQKLPFFTADEEPGYRVDACTSCMGYIKTTDFREFDRPSLPALDDLESLALDILAVKKGFIRPTASAWGF